MFVIIVGYRDNDAQSHAHVIDRSGRNDDDESKDTAKAHKKSAD